MRRMSCCKHWHLSSVLSLLRVARTTRMRKEKRKKLWMKVRPKNTLPWNFISLSLSFCFPPFNSLLPSPALFLPAFYVNNSSLQTNTAAKVKATTNMPATKRKKSWSNSGRKRSEQCGGQIKSKFKKVRCLFWYQLTISPHFVSSCSVSFRFVSFHFILVIRDACVLCTGRTRRVSS